MVELNKTKKRSHTQKSPKTVNPRDLVGVAEEEEVSMFCLAWLDLALLCFTLHWLFWFFTLLCIVLLCFVLLCFALICFALFCFALFCIVLLCFVLLCFAFCFALFCFALLCIVLLCFVLLCFALI